jgi:peptidoglycan/LPS O-acetylase OafA/YrhL
VFPFHRSPGGAKGLTGEQGNSISVKSLIHREVVPGLTGLRFIAAFCVLIAHSVTVLMGGHNVYWIKQASGFGMTLFFVLSGFVIHYNYAAMVTGTHAARGAAAFFWARFARLYPLLLLMLALYVLVSNRHLEFWLGRPERFIDVLRAVPFFVLSIQSWLYIPIGETSLIYALGPSASLTWSISTEWFFYLVYPCVAWIIVGLRSPRSTVLAAAAWCALWIFVAASLYDWSPQLDAWAVAHFGPVAGTQEHSLDGFVRWLLYFSPYLRIGEFILGALVAQFYVQLEARRPGAAENAFGNAVFIAAAVSVCVISYFAYGPGIAVNIFEKMDMNFALGPSAALLIFCAARYRVVVSRLLNTPVATMLGDASYSIYLVHLGVLLAVAWFAGSAGHGLIFDSVRLIVVIAFIITVSVLIYRFYEAPARAWLRRLGARYAAARASLKPNMEALSS